MLGFKKFLTEVFDHHRMDFEHTLRNSSNFSSRPGYIDLHHESPGHVKDSIMKHGFKNEFEGVFGTIGQDSDFVTAEKKTKVHMQIPISHVKHFFPDMPYGNNPDGHPDPHRDFVNQHAANAGKGGDVHFDHPHPERFIHKIEEVG